MNARKSSLLRQLLWAATLASGFGILWVALLLWLGIEIQEAWRKGLRNRSLYEQFVVRSDGTPLIHSMPIPAVDPPRETCRDLSGRAQDVPERDKLLGAVSTSPAQPEPGFFASQPGWDQRLKSFVNNERTPTVNWFFVHDGKREGAGYFVAYERVSKQRIGFIGLDGFRSQPLPRAEWIPVRGDLVRNYSGWSSAPVWAGYRARFWGRLDPRDLPPRLVYVPSGNRLRLVDLDARTVTTVFEAPDPIESPGIPTLSNWSGGRFPSEQSILVRTKRHMYALDRKHNVTKVFTIPTEVDRQSPADWYDTGDGQAIVVFSRPNQSDEADDVARSTMYRIAADGTIKDQIDFTLKKGSLPRNKQAEAFLLALALPEPAVLFVVDLLLAIGTGRTQVGQLVLVGLRGSSGLALLVVLALSAALAIVAWRRSRAFGLPKRDQAAWAVFVLVFGVAAYVGLLLYRRWPIRLPCPTCHAEAPRDRVACAGCGTTFPDPPLKGIELFA